MMRSRFEHPALDFQTRKRIIFHRLSASEQLFVRLNEAPSANQKLQIAINYGAVPIVKYYLESILSSDNTERQNLLVTLGKNIFLKPAIIKLLLDENVNPNAVNLSNSETPLSILLGLYMDIIRYDVEGSDGARHRIHALLESGVFLVHYGALWPDLLDLNGVESHYSESDNRFANDFKTDIYSVSWNVNVLTTQACSPEVFCSITDQSRRNIELYEFGQLGTVNIFSFCQQIPSSIYGILSSCFFRSQLSNPALDDIELTAINKNESDDQMVPEEYLCILKSEMMTTPVYDPNHKQYKFELKNILRWLSIKQEHPYTKTELTKTSLVIDEDLKQKIMEFKATQTRAPQKDLLQHDANELLCEQRQLLTGVQNRGYMAPIR